jgi:uncharacterized membrane protein YeiH
MLHSVVLASSIHVGAWKVAGNYAFLSLIAAAANALNGALLARRPDHYKNFTVVGIILMGLLMGLGGGITRDVLLNQVPTALTNPAFITVTLVAAAIGYKMAYTKGQLFREGVFQAVTSFALPLYAIVGAEKAENAGLPVAGVLALSVIAPTAGRWLVDVSCGVPPKQFIRGEWFVTIALLTGVIWVICAGAGLPTWASAAVSFAIGYTVRMVALYRGWEEPLAKEPAGVYQHSDGRPLLGRKIAHKSQRELKDLGLTIEEPSSR